MVSEIQEEINRLAKSKYGQPKYRKVFQQLDQDSSGLVDVDELFAGLESMG